MSLGKGNAKWWIEKVIVPILLPGGVITVLVVWYINKPAPEPETQSAPVEVSAEIIPSELSPGDRFTQRFFVKNPTTRPVTVESVSVETFQDGALKVSKARYFNAATHGNDWKTSAIPPGQERVIYEASGDYSAQAGCGNMLAKFIFHTSVGDSRTQTTYRAICR